MRGPQAPQTGARALPLLPPLSRAGVGGNQSWLTAPLSVWSYDTCQVKKVNPLRQGQGQRAPSGATLEWRRVAPEGGAVARVAPVYTRHIRNTKGQRQVKVVSLLTFFLVFYERSTNDGVVWNGFECKWLECYLCLFVCI